MNWLMLLGFTLCLAVGPAHSSSPFMGVLVAYFAGAMLMLSLRIKSK